jgi:hypothetical protein
MEKIKFSIILEILGRPAEHIKEALNTLVVRLGSEKGIKVLEKTYHEPIQVEGSDLFTSFAEVVLEVDSLANYFGVIFAYMPANIELISPEKITLPNSDLNELANKLANRLHEYDAMTKRVLVERDAAISHLKNYAPHLFKQPEQQTQEKSKKKADKKQSAKSKPKKSKSKK